MAEEGKQIRLMAAVKEFNLGKDTIVTFLNSKGFDVKDSPTEKLDSKMYDCLLQEYAQEKKTKQSSEAVHLSGSKRGAKPEEPASEVKVPLPVIEVPVPLSESVVPKQGAKAEAAAIEADAVSPAIAEEKVVKEEEIIEVKNPDKEEVATTEDPVVEIPTKPSKKSSSVKVVEEDGMSKVEAPQLSGPRIIKTIDLDAVKPPKRTTKKEADQKAAIQAEADAKAKAQSKAKDEKAKADAQKEATAKLAAETLAKEKAAAAAAIPEPPKEAVIDNVVQRRVLGGLKVIDKIVLPTPADAAGKRKRKRIAVDKTGFVPTGNAGGNTGGGGRSGGGQGGNRPGGNSPNYKGRNNAANRNTPRTPGDRVVTEAEVQEKLKETLARLQGGGKGKNKKSTYRRDKRDLMAEKNAARSNNENSEKLKLTEFISVSELASLMDVNFTEIIGKCMNLGIMVSINQRLDAEVIELVAGEFGYEVEFINLEQEADKDVEEDIDKEEDLISRPPVITIMGHVDHGKTSLLDNIRRANVVAGEAGGITQHIGAYEVTLPSGKQITFLDTPGHEAFTAMRARGAKVTDLAIIVIAADDAIMPQTTEAINHAQAAGTNMIFAINKMDKDGANPQKIYEQLSNMNILVEEWGGKFQSQPIAAKSGMNVDLLLEKILLEAEVMDLKANPDRNAVGSVIEASLDKGRGYVSTILVQNGTLKIGDMIVAGTTFGRVKAMFNERGGKVTSAGPSTPVQILGLNGAPQAGEKFKVYTDEDEAKEIATHRSKIMREQGMRTRKHITMDEIGRRLALGNFKQLNVIIKGDVDGSVEALSDSLIKLSTEEIEVRVIHKAVGQIAESDVTLAAASDAIIIGFQVRPSVQANKLAEDENIEIKFYSVIYDAINDVKNAMEGLLEPKIEQKRTCNIEVREIFKITGVGTVAGCFVLDGKMSNKNKINIIREGIVIYNGELGALKRFKDDAKEVFAGMECGLSVKNYDNIQVGDIIEGYEEIEVKRTL